MKKIRDLIIIFLITFFLFAALEIAARIFTSSPENQTYKDHSHLINVLGIPSLNDILESDTYLFWKLKKNIVDYRIKGQIAKDRLDFKVTTFGNHLRSAPLSSTKEEIRILALGDSCTFGVGVDNKSTWPAYLENFFLQSGYHVKVINGGVPGYSSFQGYKFLKKRGLQMKPDIVIVSFWFNDGQKWANSSDFDIAKKLKTDSLLANIRLYTLIRHLTVKHKNKQNVSSLKTNRPSAEPRVNFLQFRDILEDIYTISTENNIAPYFIIWPFRPQVMEKNGMHNDYQAIIADLCLKEQLKCVDLVPSFINKSENLFIDVIHANEKGNITAAEEIFNTLLKTYNFR